MKKKKVISKKTLQKNQLNLKLKIVNKWKKMWYVEKIEILTSTDVT